MDMIKFILLMLFTVNCFAWELLGKAPPSTHILQQGTYNAFETMKGARRYYLVDELSVCNSSPTQIQTPSGAYNIPQDGYFKLYKSPSGLLSYYPVSYAKECKDKNPPPPPPTPDTNYVGLKRLYINPTPTNPNDCTCMKLDVLEKLADGKYQVDVSVWDCAIIVDNHRVCNVK